MLKKAIIIGASSGIGRSLALLLAHNNYRVGITGRRAHLLAEIKAIRPEVFYTKIIDVDDTVKLPGELTELSKEMGGVDLLVISSGTGDLNDHLDYRIEQQTFLTNVMGFSCIAGWAFRYFEEQGCGHLAAITSVAGLRGSRQAPAYNASKACQINYLEGLRQKACKTGKPIYVTDLRPGFVNTAMAKGEGQFWVADAEKASRQIYRAIMKKKNVAYITSRWFIIGLLLKLIPGSLYNRL
jgi:short-subunit dehydrogenase